MQNKAKIAGQVRHSATTIGGFLAGIGLADSDLMTITLQWLGRTEDLDPAVQLIVGAVIAAVGFYLSWTSRAKNIGEGDQP